MKIIFNNYLIETDEIQAISPLHVSMDVASFDISILNKENPIKLFMRPNNIGKPHLDRNLWYEERAKYETEYRKYYDRLVNIWKDKQDKFLTII